MYVLRNYAAAMATWLLFHMQVIIYVPLIIII